MLRYYFHTIDGQRFLDRDGTLCAGLEQAKLEAVRRAGHWIANDPELLVRHHDCRLEVTGETGAVLFTLIMFSVEPKVFGHRS